jgi:hypothetical protein
MTRSEEIEIARRSQKFHDAVHVSKILYNNKERLKQFLANLSEGIFNVAHDAATWVVVPRSLRHLYDLKNVYKTSEVIIAKGIESCIFVIPNNTLRHEVFKEAIIRTQKQKSISLFDTKDLFV